MVKTSKVVVKQIPLEKLDEPAGGIRLEIDHGEVKALAENINEVGLLQPINVRPVGERFEVVAGHRRFLAFQLLGREKIPCIVGDFSDVGSALARASENLRRVDLSPIEEAAIYADLHDNHSLSFDEIGRRMGKTSGLVKRRLYLLRMPPSLQKAIHAKQISYVVAEELWSLGDASVIDHFLAYAVDHGCTQAVARDWVRDHRREERLKESGTDGGGGVPAPFEPRPSYFACDLCKGPFELGKETLFRCCPGCVETLKKALSASGG